MPASAQHRTAQARRDRDRFVAFAFAAADAVLEVAADGRVLYAAGAVESLLGRSSSTILDAPFYPLLAEDGRDRIERAIDRLGAGGRLQPARVHLSSGRNVVLGACRLPDKDEASVFVTLTTPLPAEGPAKGYELDRAAGVLSRAGFTSALVDRLAAGSAGDSLALIELSGMVEILNALPGPQRPHVLAAIGDELRAFAGSDGVAGRLGETRFGLLARDPIDGTGLSKRLTQAAAGAGAAPLEALMAAIPVDSGGLSAADSARALIHAIERFASGEMEIEALAKPGPTLPALLASATKSVRHLREAVVGRRVTIALQPIVALDGRRVHHHEALARFAEGDSPSAMILAAEQAGLIAELDLTIAGQALEIAAQRRRAATEMRIAINLSGRSVESPHFINQLEALLDRSACPASGILFEITETARISDLARANEMMARLRARGHAMCIDDLGIGAASFQYLSALEVDFVKIDGLYIRNAAANTRDRAFLMAMIGLCRSLGVPAIAEGIETEEQAAMVETLGATMGQGYLFGRPLLAAELPPAV
jgi:EAL domain-containing protein (putative c-di-GMP-specific phosphodiesterase class I)